MAASTRSRVAGFRWGPGQLRKAGGLTPIQLAASSIVPPSTAIAHDFNIGRVLYAEARSVSITVDFENSGVAVCSRLKSLEVQWSRFELRKTIRMKGVRMEKSETKKPGPRTYASRLEAAMKEKKCTVKELAEQLQIVPQSINNVFTGRSNTLSVVNHVLVCWYLDISPSWLALGSHTRPREDWPFGDEISPDEYNSCPEEIRAAVLAILKESVGLRKAPEESPPRRELPEFAELRDERHHERLPKKVRKDDVLSD